MNSIHEGKFKFVVTDFLFNQIIDTRSNNCELPRNVHTKPQKQAITAKNTANCDIARPHRGYEYELKKR